jgi:hypothetical protein
VIRTVGTTDLMPVVEKQGQFNGSIVMISSRAPNTHIEGLHSLEATLQPLAVWARCPRTRSPRRTKW